ncbi:MAG: hypothetical protein ACFFDN_34475, partial [Candidatus Hodarchaeota archaeon]
SRRYFKVYCTCFYIKIIMRTFMMDYRNWSVQKYIIMENMRFSFSKDFRISSLKKEEIIYIE